MHVPDGVLPASVCAAGYAASAPVLWYSLRRIGKEGNPRERIPKASLLTAGFFVASWIQVPLPPTSVHLVLNGLLGGILGHFAFPAILIGLFFQAVMFQHGGLTTLGVNAVIMGFPALLAYYVFRLRKVFGKETDLVTGVFGFLAGFTGIALGAGLFVVILITTIPASLDVGAERAAIASLALAHVPLMFIEGAFAALVTVFLHRVRPGMLESV